MVTAIDVIGLAAGWKTSLAVDANDRVHVSYYDWQRDAVKYATNRTGEWVVETVDATSGGVSDASLVLDASGKVHLVYGSYAGFQYATNLSGTWQVTTVDDPSTGRHNALARGSGSLFASYQDGYNLDLKFASKPIF